MKNIVQLKSRMSANIKKEEIISNTELSRNPKKLKSIIKKHEKAVVFNHNTPKMVILPYDKYQELIEKLDNALIQILGLLPTNDIPENRYDEENIEELFSKSKDKESYEKISFYYDEYNSEESFFYDRENEILYYLEGKALNENGIKTNDTLFPMNCNNSDWDKDKKECALGLLKKFIKL